MIANIPQGKHVLVQPSSLDDRKMTGGTPLGGYSKTCAKIHHISLLNGCTEGDKTGEYTYISPQGNSVIDYGMTIAQHLPFMIDNKGRQPSRIKPHAP